ncbi:transmembrane protein 184B-like [Hydractinia symbiolongicarpus]|uniref:transmembrane protein 184B-like n=1 Tax=Hydractinia symbiolongicarpus TaxID=13093 RepID=UPI00254A7076|nr:transmembrane protein 184B-like [Hydractinia symbiolongicarpus]
MSNETAHEGKLFFQTPGALVLSGLFSWVAIFISGHQIACHARHYTNPDQQRYILRILLIVPIYALDSWMSLLTPKHYIYFDTIRDCYEAFVIYNFLCLCYEYLGGEMAILSEIRGKSLKTSYCTLTCCCSDVVLSIEFLRQCKKATLQFCFMKPVMAAITLLLVSTGNYSDGDFRPDRGYLYITIVYNVSYTIALYGLFLFYTATKNLLSPYYPVLKFLTVKFIVFMSFWQGVVLAIIEKTGMIRTYPDVIPGEMSAGFQNFILCIEMFFAAVLLRFAFPYTIYCIQQHKLTGKVALKTISKNLRKSINPKDIVQDTIHNFAPTYQHYAGVNIAKNVEVSLEEDGRESVSYQVTIPDTAADYQERNTRNGSAKHDPFPRSTLLVETEDDDAPLL